MAAREMPAELEATTIGLLEVTPAAAFDGASGSALAVPPDAAGTPGDTHSAKRRVLQNVAVTIAIGAALVGLVKVFDSPGDAESSQAVSLTAVSSGPAPRVGKAAPDFRVQDMQGNPLQLSDLRGHPVWINFWDTWCPPCRAENPDIEAVYEAHKDEGLIVVALSVGESQSTVKGYAQRAGLNYLIGLDSATDVAAQYRLVGVPTHVFVDADGIIRDLQIGGLSKKAMEAKVAAILAPAGTSSGSR